MNIFNRKDSVEKLNKRIEALESRLMQLEYSTKFRLRKYPRAYMDWGSRNIFEVHLQEAVQLILNKLDIQLKYVSGTPETVVLEEREKNEAHPN